MGDLTKNISRHEVACNCGCGSDTIDLETAMVIQDCCDHFAAKLGVPKVVLIFTSGHRCFKYNRSIGSNDQSQHPLGRGDDIRIKGISPDEVADYLEKEYPGKYGIGRYKTFTHIDTRSNGPARW